MSEDLGKTVCFDYSHNNTLTLESPSYADFTQFLFGSSFRLGKIQAGFTGLDKLIKYKMIVIGGPRESIFEMEEINILVEYVKQGGSLLIINDEAGDYGCNTNLSELTDHFGFKFNPTVVADSMNFQNIQQRVIVADFEPHPTTRDVDGIVQSNACSIDINKTIEADENISIIPIARTSLNAYHNRWDGDQWIEQEDAPKSILSVAVNYYNGKVFGLCTVSMFSSLSSSYGLFALNNQQFIAAIFNWMLEPPRGDGSVDEKLINIGINYNLFVWMEKLVRDKKWGDIKDMINFSIKHLKDNYDEVMLGMEKRKDKLKHERAMQLAEIQKIEDVKERQRRTAMLEAEHDILKKAGGIDTAKELSDIMKSLSSITGGAIGNQFDVKTLKEPEEEKEPEPIEAKALKKPEIEPVSKLIEAEPSAAVEKAAEQPPEIPIPANILPVVEAEKPIHEAFKEEVHETLQSKLKEAEKAPEMANPIPKKQPVKTKTDEDLDAALKALGSFEDFAKKLEEFKSLTDDDGPMNEYKVDIKPSGNKIKDDELFE
jgi:hypothetical protein